MHSCVYVHCLYVFTLAKCVCLHFLSMHRVRLYVYICVCAEYVCVSVEYLFAECVYMSM